jgi:hypothetical protein
VKRKIFVLCHSHIAWAIIVLLAFVAPPIRAVWAAPASEPRNIAELRGGMDVLKRDFEERLKAQEAETRKREEEQKKESAAAIEAARKSGEEHVQQILERERASGQAANQKLEDEIRANAAKEDAREQQASPRVGAADAGLSLGGYLQSDYVIRQSSQDQLNPTSGALLNQDRIMVRRARLLIDYQRTYGGAGLEFDGNTVNGAVARLLGAQASLKLPGRSSSEPPVVMGSIGAFRVPFGLEVLQSDVDRPFMERTTASRAFFPSEYDLGLRLQGGWRFIRYAVAAMNGEPLDEKTYPALDPNHQKDIVGRIGVEVSSLKQLFIAFGMSTLYGKGFHSGNLASKGSVSWIDSDGNGSFSSNEATGTPGVSATASRNFARFAVGADLVLSALLLPEWTHLGATTLYGEFIWANNLDRGILPADPYGVLARDARELGCFVAITQAVTRHGVVGFRYDYYDPDRDRYLRIAGDLVPSDLRYQSWAIMGGLVASWGRLLLQYDINRNRLGLSQAGTPANLKDNAFTLRGEVRF